MTMNRSLQYEFHLFGGRKGQTCVINGHKFIHGVCRKVVTPTAAEPLIKVLAYYGAHPVGTDAYRAAVAREEGNGTDEVHAGEEHSAADEVHGGGGSAGAGSSAPSEDNGSGAEGAEAPGAGTGAPGDGHEDSGVPKFEDSASLPEPSEPSSVGSDDIKAAMLKLDPENADHWVRTGARAGKAKLSAVEAAYGKAGLTADDLEAALPGWDRDKAIQHMLEN